MARSFSDALNKSMDDIKRPPPLPVGLYRLSIAKVPSQPEKLNSQKGNYEKLTFQYKITGVEEVDDTDLEEYGGDPIGKTVVFDFIFDLDDDNKFDGTLARIKTMLEKAQVTGDSLSDALLNCVNAELIGEVKHRSDPTDSEIRYHELSGKFYVAD